jgi:hypothetical protein
MATDCSQQLTFWELGSQQLTVDFAGGRVVTDAGLLPLRLLDKQTGHGACHLRRGGDVASPGRCLTSGLAGRAHSGRGDSGLAVPELYEFCESHGLLYALGYSSNDVLKERTAAALSDLECYSQFYRHREEHVQRFEVIEDYQAQSWSRPRRIVAKIEINRRRLSGG